MCPASDLDTERHLGVSNIKINAILRDDESSSLVLRVISKSSDFLADTVKSKKLAEMTLEPNGELTMLLPDGLLEELQNDDHSGPPWDVNLTCVFARLSVGVAKVLHIERLFVMLKFLCAKVNAKQQTKTIPRINKALLFKVTTTSNQGHFRPPCQTHRWPLQSRSVTTAASEATNNLPRQPTPLTSCSAWP